MSKKTKKKGDLGRNLIKSRFQNEQKKKVDNNSLLHTTEIQDGYDWGRLNLNSVTEESSFQEFLRTAEMAGSEFLAEKLNLAFVNYQNVPTTVDTRKREDIKIDMNEFMKIPRRPKWNKETSAEELHKLENESFLQWRRTLAIFQEQNEQITLTPYEKNLDFWRHLWRVVERSDVIIQVVDARNPLLFRSTDLEKYVKEVNANKRNMILINKSDLLTKEQRKIWAHYFDQENVCVAFFSALIADEQIKQNANEKTKQQSVEQKLCLEELKKCANDINQSLENLEQKLKIIEDKNQINFKETNIKNNSEILTCAELVSLFKKICADTKCGNNVPTVGFVGYPNVGKSSTINALMAQKKVSVSTTPGKTKHFQTLKLEENLILCDCPGLVFPSFVLTKADMILNGILPIDQMRDYVPPVNLLCTRIPRHILEDKYGIIIAKPLEGENAERAPFAEELLLAFGYTRGLMTSNGQPDQSRSARYLCKDYVNGKLLFCVAPPTAIQEDFHVFSTKMHRKEIDEETLPIDYQRAMRINKNIAQDFDKQYFAATTGNAFIKGKSNFPHVRTSTIGDQMVKNRCSLKKEKREKLRIKYANLDQH